MNQHADGGRQTQFETGAMRPSRLLAVTVAMGMVMALGLPALGVSYKPRDILSPDGEQAHDRWSERTDADVSARRLFGNFLVERRPRTCLRGIPPRPRRRW